jgi:hypothetical protein
MATPLNSYWRLLLGWLKKHKRSDTERAPPSSSAASALLPLASALGGLPAPACRQPRGLTPGIGRPTGRHHAGLAPPTKPAEGLPLHTQRSNLATSWLGRPAQSSRPQSSRSQSSRSQSSRSQSYHSHSSRRARLSVVGQNDRLMLVLVVLLVRGVRSRGLHRSDVREREG